MTSRKNPWKTLDEKAIYDNSWISVSEHQVINPSGNPGIYGKVSFKNIAIGIIPIDENGFTWLVGQHRYTLDLWSWEIPMGGGPLDGDPLQSAQRELLEETGLSATNWERILDTHISNSITDEAGIVYVATDLTEGTPDFDDTEDIEIQRLPFTDVVRMARTGKITDVLSIAGILQYAAMQNDS
ncbi:MAG: NUDIX domain-containing protein [Gammaproteobacteria bacterium]